MTLQLKIGLLIQQTINKTPWTWTNIADQFLDGQSDNSFLTETFNTETHNVFNASKWARVGTVGAKSFLDINRVQKDPLFTKHIQWIRPIQYTAGLLIVVNAIIAWKKLKPAEEDPRSVLDRWALTIWRYTPQLAAIFNVYYNILTFKERPIPSMVYLLSLGISMVVRYVDSPTRKVVKVWCHVIPLISSFFLMCQDSVFFWRVIYIVKMGGHLNSL